MPSRTLVLRALHVGVLLATLPACRCDKPSPSALPAGEVPRQTVPNEAPPRLAALRLLPFLPRCDVFHHGLLIDVGSNADPYSRGFVWGSDDDKVPGGSGGTTFARVLGKVARYVFSTDVPTQDVRIGLRAAAGRAKSASVYLDDHRVGTLTLPLESLGVVETSAISGTIEPGLHTIELKFAGHANPKAEESATLDWIRVGDTSPPENYAAPTRGDVLAEIALGGVPAEALVLREASRVRCPINTAPGTRLRTKLGLWGSGEATAEIRALVDGEAPIVLAERQLVADEESAWLELDLSFDAVKDRLVTLEFAARGVSGAGRVAFGNPELVRDELPPATSPEASHVVVVVLSGLERSALPPWGTAASMSSLAAVAKSAVSYAGYRVGSTAVGSVMASLLTGLVPIQHGVVGPNMMLPASVPTVSLGVRQHGGASAMFTSVPHTFEAFGFARGWDRFEMFSPVSDVAATEPFKRAVGFVEDGAFSDRTTRLVVLHARGGHPPWDLSKQEAATLAPADYSGYLDARRGGVVLAEARGRSSDSTLHLKPADWVRLQALQRATLTNQATAFGWLVEALKNAGVWDQTLCIVMGDVAMGAPPEAPFLAQPDLDEARLSVPLFVRFPGDAKGGTRSTAAVTTEDITRTILAALGVEAEATAPGGDLFSISGADGPIGRPPALARRGDEFSLRLGNWLLVGARGRAPTLCKLDVDPACSTDLFAQAPLAASAMWKISLSELAREQEVAPTGVVGTLAEVDEATTSALHVWGD